MNLRHSALCFFALALSTQIGWSQSNTIPGVSVSLGRLGVFDSKGRIGTFPNGTSGFGMSTTSCNVGTVPVPFFATMQDNHPFIHFLVVREDSERLVQISDRSFVKHAFASAFQDTCSTCQGVTSTLLGIGCADTYGSSTNSNRFWLAPGDEVNPWLGEWTAFGSFFDATPVDGQRDYNGVEPNGVNHRVTINDAELMDSNASYYYQGGYIVRGEAESERDDNIGWRTFTPSWNGFDWNTGEAQFGNLAPIPGSVLEAWSGATVTSETNGADDGRVFMATKTTQNGNVFHYEYAFHNRDNHRGVSTFRIPVTPGAAIFGSGFHDVDGNAANDWTMTVQGGEIVFSTTTNPLAWNTIFNVWFDANVGPQASTITLDQHLAGAGAPSITLNGDAPLDGLPGEYCFGDGGLLAGCTDCPCGNDAPVGTQGGCANESGTSARITSSGSASVGADTLEVQLTGANPSTFAVLASGDNRLPQASPTCPPGSGLSTILLDGLRCVGGNLVRHGTRATTAVGANASPWGPGIVAQGGFVAGQTREFQCFYRQSAAVLCGTGQTTSQAISITVGP